MEGELIDAATRFMAALPSLHFLGIQGSRITKEGILKLASIPTMRMLVIESTSEIGPDVNDVVRAQFPWIPRVSVRQQAAR